MKISLAVLLGTLAGCGSNDVGDCKTIRETPAPGMLVLPGMTLATVQDSLPGDHPGILTYDPHEGMGTTTVHVEISELGAASLLHFDCLQEDIVEIPAQVHLLTEDGRFDESAPVTLTVEMSKVFFDTKLDPAHLHGTFRSLPGVFQPGETPTLNLDVEITPGQDSSGGLSLSDFTCPGDTCTGNLAPIGIWGQYTF